MFKTQLLWITLSLGFITGCGGGDGGSSSAGPSSDNGDTELSTEQAEVVEANENNEATQTSSTLRTIDLIADEYFDFSTEYTLNLVVDLGGMTANRAYFNLCPAHIEIRGQADYQNCLLQVPIIDGQFSHSIQVGGDQRQLFAEIWPIESDAQPWRYEWHYQEWEGIQEFVIEN